MTDLYGIRNCDTVKKARQWLDMNKQPYTFHDMRVEGLNVPQLARWLDNIGPNNLVNRRSTTWKQLNQNQKTTLNATHLDEQGLALLREYCTVIKRPILEYNACVYIGFTPEHYQQIFN